MGYTIVYKSFAVKQKDTVTGQNKYMIISEMGCSNVYDVTTRGQRRSRSWSNDSIAGCSKDTGFFQTESEIMDKLDKVDFDSGCYKIYGKNRDKETFVLLYKKAIKRAKTFEELRENNITFSANNFVIDGKRTYYYFSTDKDFEEFENAVKEKKDTFWINVSMLDSEFKKLFIQRKTPNQKTSKNPAVIINNGGMYIRSLSRSRLYLTGFESRAKVYDYNYAKKMLDKLHRDYKDYTFTVINVGVDGQR
jgi:hypothetical protein